MNRFTRMVVQSLIQRNSAVALCWILLIAALLPTVLQAQTTLTTTTSFTAAQSGRSYMDIGGVWNGTAEVTNTTGDTFTLAISNTGGNTAYEVQAKVTLPENFQYVANTASATSGCGVVAPVSASQAGTLLTFSLPSGYDLVAGCTLTITYGLRVATTMPASGTYRLTPAVTYSNTSNGTLNQSASVTDQNILVLQGATLLLKTPTQQSKAVGQTASFTVTVNNSGLGALYAVTINESVINPGGSLQLTSMTQTAPALAATGSAPVLTLPYLAPGDSFVVNVDATVTGCQNIINTVSSTDRTGATAKSATAPVSLDLLQPLIAYTPPNTVMDYTTPVAVSFSVQNTGLGEARSVVLGTNFNSLGVTVANVAAGWSYNASNGSFTRTGGSPAGTIANGASVTLSYTLEPDSPNLCGGTSGGTVVWYSSYTNGCGDAYGTPTLTSSVSAPNNQPSISLGQSVSAQRLANGESGSYVLTLSASNLSLINGTNLVVTETVPANLTGVSLVASGGTANLVGNIITWTVPIASLGTSKTLTVNFNAQSDPCATGVEYSASASVSATSTRGCPLSAGSSATYLLTNNPGATVNQFFEINPAASDGVFETGNASADSARDISLGEGEFIPLDASYQFGGAYPGLWSGTTYVDDFAGVSQQSLVPGTAQISVNGGAFQSIPGGSITGGSGSLTINLGFVAGASFANSANVAGFTIEIRYKTTITDAGLGGGNSRSLLQLSTLTVNSGGGAGACVAAGNEFRQGVYYSIARAAGSVGLAFTYSGGTPNQLSICEEFNATLTVSNSTAEKIRNVLVTLNSSGAQYTYLTGGSQTVTYGGDFNAGNMTYSENGGINPTFAYSGSTLVNSGTITFKLRLKATAPISPSSLGATLAYDDVQTSPTPATREFSANGSTSPFLVRSAAISLTVTPDNVVVTGSTMQWKIYVTNGGNGPAYNSTLRNTLYDTLEVNSALTNAANAGYPVTVSGASNEILSWSLGDIPAGVTRLITIVADITGSTGCTIPANQNIIVAEWGCGGALNQTVTKIAPNYTFPAGQMLVAHDTTNSVARLCDDGVIYIIVRNTGPTEISAITLKEILDPTSGLTYLSGTTEYSINSGGSWFAAGDPSGTGSAGSPYTWTSAQVSNLAMLYPGGVGGPQEVRIRFSITAGAAFAAVNPSATASATGSIACGNAVNSPGTSTAIPTQKPNVSIAVTGRNITANPVAAYTDNVYGGVGEQVEWKIVISNSGNQTARNVRFRQAFAGSGGTAVINGNGYANAVFSNNTYYTHLNTSPGNDLAQGATATYYVTETLGGSCVSASTTANVLWGCLPPNPIVNLTGPGTLSDTATLIMIPNLNGASAAVQQSVVNLAGGRAQITLSFTNTGGTATAISLSDALPSGITVDGSGAISYSSSNTSITGVSWNASTTNPVFSFTPGTGIMRYLDTASVSFYVISTHQDTTATSSFPDLAVQETTANGYDPLVPVTSANNLTLSYQSSCAAGYNVNVSPNLDLATPDLDVVTVPTNAIITPSTAAANYDFVIRNEGDPNSVGGNISIVVTVGKGWNAATPVVSSPAGTGIGGLPAAVVDSSSPDFTTYTYTLPTSFTLTRPASGNSPDIRVRMNTTPANNSSPLTYKVQVTGAVTNQANASVGYNYSFDRRAARFLGVEFSKVNVSPDSTTEADSSSNTMMIGEEITYRLHARFFGAEAGEEITGITVRDTLADSNDSPAHSNLGYLGYTTTGSNTATISTVTSPTSPTPLSPPPVRSGRIEFGLADVTTGASTFEVDLKARLLNVGATGVTTTDTFEGKSVRNNFGMSFTYLGQVFRSNDTDDGYGGGTSSPNLHSSSLITVRRPGLQVTKSARNLTKGDTSFTATINGQAGDLLEYRVVITNPSARIVPLYDITVTDTLPAKLNLLGTDIGADTNADNVVDLANVGGFTAGPGGTIVFNQSNTAIPTSGQNFDRLLPNTSITLLYRATVEATVIPSEVILNNVAVTGDTLPSASGSQSIYPAATGANDGAAQITSLANAATLIINSVEQAKVIVNTSVGADTSANVQIGEQVLFEISYVLPQGMVPNFKILDTLPAGLGLVATPAVAIGSAISGAQPTITPATLPANGNPLAITWDFGTRTVAVGTAAERTVTLQYLTQVLNVATTSNGTILVNNVRYQFTGSPVNGSSATLTVRAPVVVVTKSVNPNSGFNAGATLTYTLTIDNTTGIVPAFEINVVDELDPKSTFVASSVVITESVGVTGTIAEPDVAGQILTWGRTQSTPLDIDIAAGGKLTFTYQVTVNDGITFPEVVNNQATVDWTSMDGDPGADIGVTMATAGTTFGERTGTGVSPNTFRSQVTANATSSGAYSLLKVKSNDTLPIDSPTPSNGFRVGDVATYTVTITLPEGTTAGVAIKDTLPTGMELVDFSPLSPVTGTPFTYTQPVAGSTAPAAGATGLLTWTIGTVVNTGDNNSSNDTLTLVYRVRIKNNATAHPATPTTKTISNSAVLAYTDGASAAQATTPNPNGIAAITLRQPLLTIAKALVSPGDATLYTGETARFRLTITNTGTAPAYNPTIVDTLPAGLRGATPTLVTATLNGADISGTITPLSYNSGSGQITFVLTDPEFLLPVASAPNNTLVITYDVTAASSPLNVNQSNSASITQYFSKPSGDTTERRTYAAVGPVSQTVILRPSVSGYVYWDIVNNSTKDGSEDWTQGPTVYLNLVQAGAVLRSITITPGSGFYNFTEVTSGSYSIVVSNGAANPNPVVPANWFFRSPPSGSLPITVASANLANQNFGLYTGSTLQGNVFQDDGAGGGIANDGIRNGGEVGLPNVSVSLTNCGGTTYFTGLTNGAGDFILAVPTTITTGTQLCITETNPGIYTSTGGGAGDTGGTYTLATDTVTFSFTSGVNHTGIRFGDVPPSRLLTDGLQTIIPGATAFYSHQFIAGTAGSVVFSLASSDTPNIPGWSTLLYVDTNGNASIDGGEPLVTGAIAVTAGQTIHLLVKDTSPPGAIYGAQNQTLLTAVLTYTLVSPSITETLQRNDLTTLGQSQIAGLKLVKATDKSTALPGETITYTITYTNVSSSIISNLIISDQTPSFTTFSSAAVGLPLPSALSGSSITHPGIGATGAIQWIFTGDLQSAQSGTVSYTVTISN